MAISKDCPVWKKEKLIQKIKAERNISYPEARRAAEALAPPMLSQSYARVAKPSVRTIECQTDCTWITGDKPARFTPEVKVNTATQRPMTAQSLFVCLFVCGISLTSGQLVSELFPDCTRSCFSQVVLCRRGGDRIFEMRCLFVAVGPNARFIVLPHWDNMS